MASKGKPLVKTRNRTTGASRAPGGRYFFDDGIDPRKAGSSLEPTRSALHADGLCSQVADALAIIFGGASDDERLWDLGLVSVRPAPGGSRLIVTVCPLPGEKVRTVSEIHEMLKSARPFLRREIALAICRRRTPEPGSQLQGGTH
jgi:ribosome-binding factor A